MLKSNNWIVGSKLEDWIIESRFFKACFGKGPEFAGAAAALAGETRSMSVERSLACLRAASVFAWKI